MRQISKVVLLIAPVVLASYGCASKPAWISQKTDAKAKEEVASSRTERLMKVAKKYETEGKPEVAYQLYRHIVNQDPGSTEAQNRMAAVAPRKTDNSEVRLASKSKRKPLPKAERSPSSLIESSREVAKVDWADAKKQAALKRIAAETQENRVNTIELSYGGPTSGAKVSDANKIVGAEETKWAKPLPADKSAESIASKSASSQKFAEPINAQSEPANRPSDANSSIAEMSQEWWGNENSQEIAKPIPQESNRLAELTQDSDSFSQIHEEASIQSSNPNAIESLIARGETRVDEDSVKNLCKEDTTDELIQVVALLDCPEPEVRIAGLIELGIKGTEASATSPAVRALLHDQDAMVRAHAAGTVRDIEGNNSDSVKHLATLLSESDPGVVRLSCYLLGQMGEAANPAVTRLEQLRDTHTGLTSLHAAEALTRIVPEKTGSYDVLKQALTCDDAECRIFAAVSLGGVYNSAGEIAATALTEALESSDPNVRASAALSLGGLGKHASIAIEQLQEIADSDTPEVRDAALTALACLGM